MHFHVSREFKKGRDGVIFERTDCSRYVYGQWERHDIWCLPDIRITVPPLIDFRLHDLADYKREVMGCDGTSVHYEECNWRLKVRQRSWGVYYGSKIKEHGAPKMTLTCSGSKNLVLSFRMPPRPLYREVGEFYEDLLAYKFRFQSSHAVLVPAAVTMEPEERVLKRFNDEREERLRERRRRMSSSDALARLVASHDFDEEIIERVLSEPPPAVSSEQLLLIEKMCADE